MPSSPLHLLFLLLALGFVVAFVQVGVLTIAFDKLGLSQGAAFTLLLLSLGGSLLNLPLFSMRSEEPPPEAIPPQIRRMMRWMRPRREGRTIVAINVGGGLVPVFFSMYLLQHHPLSLGKVLVATGLVAAVCYLFSRPIPGMGIGMPVFVAPIAAALTAIAVSPEHSPPLAYICGTMGVLIGADLLRLNDIRHLGSPLASIGGAGTFDGIFITGIVAVLLA